MTFAPSEDSDQPGHLPSLIRVFAIRMKKHWTLNFLLSTQWRLWSDWADAQADLSLHCVLKSFCWFCCWAAHYFSRISVFNANIAHMIGHGIMWATSPENLFMQYANNNGADQPAHLISAFVVCCLGSIIAILATCISKISRPWLVFVAEQASLSLTWSQTWRQVSHDGAHVVSDLDLQYTRGINWFRKIHLLQYGCIRVLVTAKYHKSQVCHHTFLYINAKDCFKQKLHTHICFTTIWP